MWQAYCFGCICLGFYWTGLHLFDHCRVAFDIVFVVFKSNFMCFVFSYVWNCSGNIRINPTVAAKLNVCSFCAVCTCKHSAGWLINTSDMSLHGAQETCSFHSQRVESTVLQTGSYSLTQSFSLLLVRSGPSLTPWFHKSRLHFARSHHGKMLVIPPSVFQKHLSARFHRECEPTYITSKQKRKNTFYSEAFTHSRSTKITESLPVEHETWNATHPCQVEVSSWELFVKLMRNWENFQD